MKRMALVSNGKEVELPEKKNAREKFDTEGLMLVEKSTGVIYSRNVAPLYDHLTTEDYAFENGFFLEAMSAYEYSSDKTQEAMKRFEADKNIFAEEKEDGHRALGHITEHETIRMFSKRISAKTDWFSENTDTMPHIRDAVKMRNEGKAFNDKLDMEEAIYSVMDGEFHLEAGTDSSDVQSITGAKPVNALYTALTEKGFGVYTVFDLLYFGGERIMQMPLWKRKLITFRLIKRLNCDYIQFGRMYMKGAVKVNFVQKALEFNNQFKILTSQELKDLTDNHITVVDSYETLFNQMLATGHEGIMIKDMTMPYVEKESKAFIKFKGKLTCDVVLMGAEESERLYTGNEIASLKGTWDYWEDAKGTILRGRRTMAEAKIKKLVPVTRPWANGWIGAVIYGVYRDGKLFQIGNTSGMTDDMREYLTGLYRKGKLNGNVIEVEAQRIKDRTKGTLQHPRFVRMRPDKNAKDCTWERHIRK